MAHDPLLAGQKTRRETGYMLEVAQAAAMRERKHVWIDGSLRDSEWYARVFGEIHRDYPAYRIAILYVTADPEVVLQRVRKRGEATGRFIPEQEVLRAWPRSPPGTGRGGLRGRGGRAGGRVDLIRARAGHPRRPPETILDRDDPPARPSPTRARRPSSDLRYLRSRRCVTRSRECRSRCCG